LICAQDLVNRVEKSQLKFIDLQFTDVVGMVKNVTIPTSELLNALRNGIWFDGSSIEGFARIAESDMHLRPDIATFAVVPWLSGEEATARLICDVNMPNGLAFPGDPRAILKRVLSDAAEMGFRFQVGPELEFFLLKVHQDGSFFPPTPHDAGSYFDAPSDMAAGLRRQMANALTGFGIQVESMHHEGAAGQHEIDFRYSDALITADNVVTLRVALSYSPDERFVCNLFTQAFPRNKQGTACTCTKA
jgi:glutamine synthetase